MIENYVTFRDEVRLQREGNAGLAGPAEAGEPDGGAAEAPWGPRQAAQREPPLGARYLVLLLAHVCRHLRALQHTNKQHAPSVIRNYIHNAFPCSPHTCQKSGILK